MPVRRYSITTGLGNQDNQVTEAVGSATVTTAIELSVEFGATVLNGGTAALTKMDVLIGLEQLYNYIADRPFPPV
jgi:hypothetical protein